MITASPFRVSRRRLSLASLLLFVASFLALTASGQFPVVERAEVRLLADQTAYPPGATARLAAVVEIEDGWHVNANLPTFDYLIPTELELEAPGGWPQPTALYPAGEMLTFAFEDEPLAVYEGEVRILAAVPVPASAAAGEYPLSGTFRYQACDDNSCLPPVTTAVQFDLAVGDGGETINAAIFGDGEGLPAGRGGPPGSLGLFLLFGVIGGLILNAMPCVLPILSLKVFGMVKSAGQGRAHVVSGSLATAAGILVSFWALAFAAIGARAAGAAVGWGVQFQQPAFVTFLAVVIVLFSLNLWGLFEITLPGSAMRAMDSRRQGLGGHFVSGLFATLMATPCSAPFLGTAIGFALAQPGLIIFTMFTAVGFGMALPYLLLAVFPGSARWLPKPGAWMDTLRKVMGFLLAAAAVWLLYVLAGQISAERLAFIELGLLALALFVWLRGREKGRIAATAAALVMAVGTIGLAATAATGPTRGTTAATETARYIQWQEFDRDRAESLAAAGTPVFVDVTADWCFTCKTNERLVLETPEVARLFEDAGVVAMKADWTNRDDTIAAFLNDHGRYSIPFYLLYRPNGEPHLFSELLTTGQIAEALQGIPRIAQAR
ncbi:MAG: thioredoxin family protein [Acidobacteriota bacterium]